MRTALIFPPQWDPRQPHLALPTLSGFLTSRQVENRCWDLNLALFRQLLKSPTPGGIEDYLLTKYLAPEILRSAEQFNHISTLLQQQFHERYDSRGDHQLFWDTLAGPLSVNRSPDWKSVCNQPNLVPALRFLHDNIQEIVQWKPQVIGISIVSDTQLLCGLALASQFRKMLPSAQIILGGPAIRFRRHRLQDHSWLFETITGIGLADGETTFAALADARPLADIPNLLWFNGREVVTNPFGTMASEVLPDFSVLPLGDYLTPALVIPVATASGCPWGKCAFCNHPHHHLPEQDQYQPRPLSRVLVEVSRHVQHGRTRFFFVDESLNVDRLREFCHALGEQRLNISWLCYSRFDERFTESDFQTIRASGCRKIYFGLETASQRLLDLYRKGTTVESARRNLLAAGKTGIAVHLFIMTGFPGETLDDQQATLRFLEDILPASQAFGFTWDLFPLACELGTPLHASLKTFGVTSLAADVRDDLSYRFTPEAENKTTPHIRVFAEAIQELVERHLGQNGPALRHLQLNQDSLHLPLIEQFGG